jgi:osmotically-inducible protein OsmY
VLLIYGSACNNPAKGNAQARVSDETGTKQIGRPGPTPNHLQERADLALERRVRQAMMGNKNLSAIAKNIAVNVRDGMVTLRGYVRNDQEMAEVVIEAKKIAGADKVDDQLDVLNN